MADAELSLLSRSPSTACARVAHGRCSLRKRTAALHGQRRTFLIDGRIETVSAAGLVVGWARDDDLPGACRVQVRYHRMMVAEAMADIFRADLLRAGQGHGHYGFHARLRHPLPPGPCDLLLHVPHAGISAPMRVTMPKLEPPQQVSVAELLSRQPGWTTADLTAHPGCVDADASFARLGPERFVDAVFRFVFARWPSPAELRMNVDSLRAGRVSPRALLMECLCSRERADMDPALTAPFDSDYPFLTTPSRQAALSDTRQAALSDTRPAALTDTRPAALTDTPPATLSDTRPAALPDPRQARPATLSDTGQDALSDMLPGIGR